MAAEYAPPPTAQPEGNFFTRHIGGLPIWGWAAIVVVGVGVAWWFFWRNGSSNTSTDAQSVPNGLAIDPSSGLPYGTSGQGGLNPAGAFAGETTYDPFANTNSLLQQILNNQQNGVNPPTTTGSSSLVNGFAISKGETLNQIAARFGLKGESIYYSNNPNDVALRGQINTWYGVQGKPGNATQKFANVVIPAGYPVYLGSASTTNQAA